MTPARAIGSSRRRTGTAPADRLATIRLAQISLVTVALVLLVLVLTTHNHSASDPSPTAFITTTSAPAAPTSVVP
jgi:hypothetical protein